LPRSSPCAFPTTSTRGSAFLCSRIAGFSSAIKSIIIVMFCGEGDQFTYNAIVIGVEKETELGSSYLSAQLVFKVSNFVQSNNVKNIHYSKVDVSVWLVSYSGREGSCSGKRRPKISHNTPTTVLFIYKYTVSSPRENPVRECFCCNSGTTSNRRFLLEKKQKNDSDTTQCHMP
jgi:hypothetical protein